MNFKQHSVKYRRQGITGNSVCLSADRQQLPFVDSNLINCQDFLLSDDVISNEIDTPRLQPFTLTDIHW